MKKLGTLIGAVTIALAMTTAVQADLGVRVTSPGRAYLSGRRWGGGAWPASGSLITIIWSPVDYSAATAIATDLKADAAEEIIGTTPSLSYGLLYAPLPTPPAVKAGLAPNSGFVYARLFADVAPAEGGQFVASQSVLGNSLTEYSAADPSSWYTLNITPAGPAEMNGVVVPEPGTLALCGLGLIAMFVRRKRG